MTNPSPSVPPLPSFISSLGPAAQQPVIPEPPIELAENLDWDARPQHPGAFPVYPSLPSHGPGFQPPALTAAIRNTNSKRMPPISTTEFFGYQRGAPSGMHPGSSAWSATTQPTPWLGMSQTQGQSFLPFPGHPMSYTPYNNAWTLNAYRQCHGWPLPVWGMPVTRQTGAAPPMTPISPGPVRNAPPHAAWPTRPGYTQEHSYIGRPAARVGDRVDPFMAGSGYGPVLDPFEVQILQHVHSRINPLLEPIADTAPDRPSLKWNMLFRSNDCYLSTDGPHVSWSKGRDEPATFPRVTKITIVSETFPWTVPIEASNPAIGVTCEDVIDQLSTHFSRLTSKQDFEMLDHERQTFIAQVYRQNRSRTPGVPGGSLGEGMRRLDYLGKDIIFGGIYRDDQVVYRLLGTRPPCHYVLKCLKQYALTAQEKEEEDRRRAEARRQAIVDDDSDSDDGI